MRPKEEKKYCSNPSAWCRAPTWAEHRAPRVVYAAVGWQGFEHAVVPGKFAAVFEVRMYSPGLGWCLTYPEKEWPLYCLLWLQLGTLMLPLLKYPLHRLATWLSAD